MSFSKDKHIIIPLFLAFSAVVAFRTWKDMHPPPTPKAGLYDTYYFVKDDAALKPFTSDPDDARPLVIMAGNIVTAKDGSLSVKSTPVAPVSLPQREIIPVFTLDAVPSSPEALAKTINEATEKWTNLGDLINDVYVDAPRDSKSLGKMLDQVNEVHMHGDYWLGLFVDRKALENVSDAKTRLEEANKSMRTLILNQKEAQNPGEKLPQLIEDLDKAAVLPYLIEVKEAPDFEALHKELQPEPERFVGFLVDNPPTANNAKP